MKEFYVEPEFDAECIFQRSGAAWKELIHPESLSESFRKAMDPVLDMAPFVKPKVIETLMVEGDSWSQRLLGLALAMATRPQDYAAPVLRCLSDPRPRSYTTVPFLAALALVKREYLEEDLEIALKGFNRDIFDGEMGWALDKFWFTLKRRDWDPGGDSPIFGQNFEKHVAFFEWLKAQ